MPDPVEQDFTADGSAYLNVLLEMSAATDKWAQNVLDDVELVKIALDSLHGENIDIGVDVTGLSESMAAIQRDIADTSADAMMQTAILGELRDMMGSTAVATTRAAQATQDQGNSAIFATQAMSLFAIGLGVTHLLVTSLGANVVADAIGFTAFGIAATQAIGPVISGLSTLTTSYGTLDNYQRAAALSLQSFLNSLGNGSEPQVFTVFNQALDLIESHMGGTAGVTSQASIAFMDFFAMLKQQFQSAGWVELFTRSTGAIRTDMDALFGLLNNAVGLIPGIFHDFNGLGLGVIGFASGVLHATAAVLEFDPALTKIVAGVSLAATAWHLLGNSISWVPAMGPTLSALASNFTKTYQGARIAGQGILDAGLTAAGAVPAFLAIAAAGVGFVAIANSMPDPIQHTISALTAQDQAVGDNAAGYSRLSASLNEYLTHQKQLPADVSPRSLIQVAQAQALAASTANTLNHNFAYLNATYGLTQMQAYQTAKAVGFNLKDALTGSSQAAQEARTKFAAYMQTINTARQVETQFAFDMSEATNSTLAMSSRLQGLTTAFAVLSGPLLQAMYETATFKQQQDALSTAVKHDGDVVGDNTQKQAALSIALAATAQQAMKASTAILNNTGSARAAAGPLIALRDEIRDLGLKGQEAAALVSQLNQEIAALHSKTVTLTVNTVQTTTVYTPTYAHRSAQGGNALGTTAAQPGIGWVGEGGPELIAYAGGEQVIPARQAMAMAGRAGAASGTPAVTVNVTVNGSVLAEQDLRSSVQQAVLDAWTRTGQTGFSPYGRPVR